MAKAAKKKKPATSAEEKEFGELRKLLGENYPASDDCLHEALCKARRIADLSPVMQWAVYFLGAAHFVDEDCDHKPAEIEKPEAKTPLTPHK